MERYESPAVIATYPILALRRDAATCLIYNVSDELLKRDIETVEHPLAQLDAIRTH